MMKSGMRRMTVVRDKELIINAEKAIRLVGKEFNGKLKQRVLDLETAIIKRNYKEASRLAYNLETEAATFGWPRVTRICKWLRKVLTNEYDRKPTEEEILVTLNTLKLITGEPEAEETGRDMALFTKLYPVLSAVIADI